MDEIKKDGLMIPPDHKEPGVYPDLKERIEARSFRIKLNLFNLLGMRHILQPLMDNLMEAVNTGHVTTGLYMNEGNGGPGIYRIKMTRPSTEQFVDAVERFLSNPLTPTAADAMGPELEDLLSGNADSANYQRVGDMQES